MVGVYDETTKSEMHNPGLYDGPYIPAAWSGRNESGPVGHHHIRWRSERLGRDCKKSVQISCQRETSYRVS